MSLYRMIVAYIAHSALGVPKKCQKEVNELPEPFL